MSFNLKLCESDLSDRDCADREKSDRYAENPNNITLLIAEDNPSNYKLFECTLRKEYTLLHAWDGREAVELYVIHRPDMILMDIKMPEMNGFQAAATIREISPCVPIIAVTALAFPEDMERISACGFDGCLIKPVKVATLKEMLEFCYHKK